MLEPTASQAVSEAPDPEAGTGDRRDLDRTTLCPYLRTSEGDWRAAWALRDHRCGAVEPPAIVTADKQRRLCLVPEHVGCATYEAAERTLSAADPGGRADHDARWAVPRTAPVVLDRSGRGFVDWRPDRSLAQVGLVILMLVAFAMLAIARLSATPTPSTPARPSVPAAAPSPTASASSVPGSAAPPSGALQVVVASA